MSDSSNTSSSDDRQPIPAALYFTRLYPEIRDLAAGFLRRERNDYTLRPSDIVHEVYLRLKDDAGLMVNGRAHLLAICGRIIRRILVDYARKIAAVKHGGHLLRVSLDHHMHGADDRSVEMLELDRALRKLTKRDHRAAEVVQNRFFGGLTNQEIADVMGMSERWVRDQWTFSRAWLRKELRDG